MSLRSTMILIICVACPLPRCHAWRQGCMLQVPLCEISSSSIILLDPQTHNPQKFGKSRGTMRLNRFIHIEIRQALNWKLLISTVKIIIVTIVVTIVIPFFSEMKVCLWKHKHAQIMQLIIPLLTPTWILYNKLLNWILHFIRTRNNVVHEACTEEIYTLCHFDKNYIVLQVYSIPE